ncbi:MAG: serine protease [Paracoccaceae bacterium]
MIKRFLLAIALVSGPLHAQDTPLVSLDTGEANRGWEAVGRLDIAGKGFCTAALIRETMILTAAHCLFDFDGTPVTAERITFSAGLRGGRADATRGVSRLAVHPDYAFDPTDRTDNVAVDIAVLELDQAIRLSRVQPFSIAPQPDAGERIGIVSYGRGRENAPSLQDVCNVIGKQRGVVAMTCSVDFGSSGAPVFRIVEGRAEIVSVVSAMAELEGAPVSLGTSLDGPLDALMAHFAAFGPARPGGSSRLLSVGQRNDTGAKFVRP